MPTSSTSVVQIGTKVCKPFLIEVMVFSPESGYKFKVLVERSCPPEADPSPPEDQPVPCFSATLPDPPHRPTAA
jgi:hypothetical protein